MIFANIALPQITRASESKYDAIFSQLPAGTDSCHLETDFIDAEKMRARLNGAISAYRARTGDKTAFAVRVIKHEGADVVGVWKLTHEITPRKAKAKAE